MTQDKIVKIIEITEEQVLHSYTMNELEKAYEQAAKLEEMGIEVKVIAPSAPETLAMALGSSEDELNELKESINHEISEHDLEDCVGCIATYTK